MSLPETLRDPSLPAEKMMFLYRKHRLDFSHSRDPGWEPPHEALPKACSLAYKAQEDP